MATTPVTPTPVTHARPQWPEQRRRDAVRWLADRLAWERALAQLRHGEERRAARAA
jgi:hypothetical protein